MTRIFKFRIPILPFLLLYAAATVHASDVLTAKFSDHLRQVNVRLCFDGHAPSRLYRNASVSGFTQGIFLHGTRIKTSMKSGALRLPALPTNACIDWQVNLQAALQRKDYRLIIQRGNDLEMSADLWFWRGSGTRKIQVHVFLPKHVEISTPWPAAHPSQSQHVFIPDDTPAWWEARVAIGYFEVINISIPDAQVRLAAIGDMSVSQTRKIRHWITQTIASVSQVSGRLPQNQPQVLVVPVGHRHEAVVHGKVMRGGGVSAEFYVDETRPLKEFTHGWTATHEFSHMLLPYIANRDRWLSEGLASYYQNVLRARDGRLTARAAWQALYEGFQRGKKNTHGETLAQAGRYGRQSTMRIYWSGAALMLMADMELRSSSNGQQSLDRALAALSGCCMENGKTWRAGEMFSQLDKLTGTSIFSRLFGKYVYNRAFPDLRNTWEKLGIDTRNKRIIIRKNAPLAWVRDDIMKG